MSRSGHCLNCGTALTGPYCHHCGQGADTGRITGRSLLRDHYRALGRLDSEIARTAWALARDPGTFCREYLDGKRRGRTPPVSYFFVSFFASFVLLAADRWVFSDLRAEASPAIDMRTQVLTLAVALVWAMAHRFVYRKAGYNLAEHAACMLYLYGQLNIIAATALVASAPLASRWPGLNVAAGTAAPAVAFVYFAYFGSRFYRKPFLKALADALAVTAVFLVVFAPLFGIWVVAAASRAAQP